MANKDAAKTNYDILDRILGDSERSVIQSARENFTPLQRKDGTWINTYEEYMQLTTSVNDIEAYLRS